MSNILADAVGTPPIFSVIQGQHMPIVLYKHLDAACGLSVPYEAVGVVSRKCLRENSPGKDPQPMREKQWAFHVCLSRTTQILHSLLWFQRRMEPQWAQICDLFENVSFMGFLLFPVSHSAFSISSV